MAGYYLPLPGAEIKNALVDFSPINNGLETLRDQKNTNRNALMQQRQLDNADKRLSMDQESHAQSMKTSGLDYSTKLAQRSAGIAQMVMSEKDPARKAQLTERMYAMHPDYKANLQNAGLDPNDHDGVANFVIAQARGYVDPLERQAKELGIQAQRSSIATNDLQRQQLQMKIDQERNFSKMFDGIGQPQQPTSSRTSLPGDGAGRFASPGLTQAAPQPRQGQNAIQAAVAKLSPDKQVAFKLAWQSGERDSAIKMLQNSTEGLGPYKGAKEKADVEEGLRKEYAGIAKPYFEVRDAYARVNQSAQTPSPAGDLALIFNYMKMLDPGSVVREAEFATAARAGSYGDIIQAQVNRIASGERLTDAMRKDFVSQAQGLMSRQEKQYLKTQEQYRGIAKRVGVTPENVMIDFTSPAEETAPPPDQNANPAKGGTVSPRDEAEYRSLPSGTAYIDPEGNTRVKP